MQETKWTSNLDFLRNMIKIPISRFKKQTNKFMLAHEVRLLKNTKVKKMQKRRHKKFKNKKNKKFKFSK